MTKYYYVVSVLDQSTAGRILHVLGNPPDQDKYEDLKRKLIATFGLSRRGRASRLLHLSDLGDRKPSELMDEILSLLDNNKPCLLAEQIFLEQLPEDIRVQIADADFNDPRALALRADIMWQAKRQSATYTVCPVTVRKEESKTKVQHQSDWCFYHSKFGEQARKCRSPFKYPGNARVASSA